MTITWNKILITKCVNFNGTYIIEIQNGTTYRKQIITSSTDITISDLSPCSEYFIYISASNKTENIETLEMMRFYTEAGNKHH